MKPNGRSIVPAGEGLTKLRPSNHF